ncbi:acyltransferase family protein [Streptomyces sp. NPDC002845]
METSFSTPRLPTLTGLRFFAAFSVFLSHVYYTFWFAGDSQAVVTRAAVVAGSAGVAFFFLLSGFVLTWSAGPASTARSFWRRRMVKIYPNHLVTWALALLLILWTGGTVTTGQAVPSVLLIHSWLPSFDVHTSVNGVSWSLSCELVFYLCFPLLLPAIRKIPVSRLARWASLNTAAIAAVPLIAVLLITGTPKFADLGVGLHQHWFVYVFPGTRLLEFTLGMLLARMVRENLLQGIKPRHALLAGCAAAPLAVYGPFLFSVAAALVVPFALTIVAFANRDVRARKSLLSSRFLVWLGEISFAFYLVHALVMSATEHLVGLESMTANPVAKVLWATALLAASVVCSWGLYTLVERPLMGRFGGRQWAWKQAQDPEAGGRSMPGTGVDART